MKKSPLYPLALFLLTLAVLPSCKKMFDSPYYGDFSPGTHIQPAVVYVKAAWAGDSKYNHFNGDSLVLYAGIGNNGQDHFGWDHEPKDSPTTIDLVSEILPFQSYLENFTFRMTLNVPQMNTDILMKDSLRNIPFTFRNQKNYRKSVLFEFKDSRYRIYQTDLPPADSLNRGSSFSIEDISAYGNTHKIKLKFNCFAANKVYHDVVKCQGEAVLLF